MVCCETKIIKITKNKGHQLPLRTKIIKKEKTCVWCVAKHKKTETITTNKGHQLPVIKTNIKYYYNTQTTKTKTKKKVTQPSGAGFRTR